VKELFDASGLKKTTLDSYQRGLPQSVVFDDASAISVVVNNRGEIDSLTDQLGFKSCYAYDAMSRLTRITHPSETAASTCDNSAWNATSTSYQSVNSLEYGIPAGHWKSTETTGARRTETYFDGLWRPILTRQNATDSSVGDRFTRRRFDDGDREVFVSYPVAALTDYSTIVSGSRNQYDALDRMTQSQIDSELGVLTSTMEYLSPFTLRSTNPRGFSTSTTYQAFDQPSTDAPVQISAPETQITTTTRDIYGKPLTIERSGSYTPVGGAAETQSLTRRYVYDEFQRLCKQTEPESGVTVIEYDASNNVAWQAIGLVGLISTSNCQRDKVPAAVRSVRHYDGLNRMIALDHPPGSDDMAMSYAADGVVSTASLGTLNTATPPSLSSVKNAWTYDYNRRRLLTSETLAIDGRSSMLSWRYNPRGDQEGLIYPSGLNISFLPNAYGEPRQAGAFASSVTRHPNGAINSFSYGNTLIQTTTQNTRQLPLRRTVGTLMDQTHAYDENANILTLTDGTAGAGESRSLSFDELDRMTSANAPAQLGNESYAFDALDNPRRASIGSNIFTHTINAQNRLTQIQKDGALHFSYSHNAQGDTTLRQQVGMAAENIFANGFENAARAPEFAPVQVLNYDRAHRLTSITGVESYQYDAHGRRVRTTGSNGLQRYQLYSNAGVLMNTEDQRTNEVIDYINLEGQLIAERVAPISGGAVTTRYQHADLRGSPTVVSSAGGAQVERSIEQPFGAPYSGIYRDGPGFTGHATDAASGLSYMQQRYYDPIAMRFLSVDPAQSEFSRYAYGANNPYKFVDPDGRAFEAFWATLAVAGTDAAVPEPTDAVAPVKIAGYAGALIGTAIAGSIFYAADAIMSEGGGEPAGESEVSDQPTQGATGGERAGKPFTPSGKREVIQGNRDANDGETVCEGCEVQTTPGQQSQKGVTTPGNETRVDHIHPQAKGGNGSADNGQVLCSDCNLDKSDKTDWIPPKDR
jgi:RHS repeat-associated protein